MKYCRNCGNSIDENAIFCPSCGTRVSGDNPKVNTNPFDRYNPGYTTGYYDTTGSTLIAVVSFLCWEAGLIIWLLWRYSHPGKARSAAKGALANVCVGMPVLGFVLWLVFREDFARKDYAKVCGICAIVGGAVNLLVVIVVIVLHVTGAVDAGFYTSFPFGDMAAVALGLLG